MQCILTTFSACSCDISEGKVAVMFDWVSTVPGGFTVHWYLGLTLRELVYCWLTSVACHLGLRICVTARGTSMFQRRPTADAHGGGSHSEVSPLFQEEAQGSFVPQILGSAANLRKKKEESPGESLDTNPDANGLNTPGLIICPLTFIFRISRILSSLEVGGRWGIKYLSDLPWKAASCSSSFWFEM